MFQKITTVLIIVFILGCASHRRTSSSKNQHAHVNSNAALCNKIIGKSYGYEEQAGPISVYPHYVQFSNDSMAMILMGGDVMEVGSYTVLHDTIYVHYPSYEPMYHEKFYYSSDTLIDEMGKRWARLLK